MLTPPNHLWSHLWCSCLPLSSFSIQYCISIWGSDIWKMFFWVYLSTLFSTFVTFYWVFSFFWRQSVLCVCLYCIKKLFLPNYEGYVWKSTKCFLEPPILMNLRIYDITWNKAKPFQTIPNKLWYLPLGLNTGSTISVVGRYTFLS